MKNLVGFLVKSLVNHPDDVKIAERLDGNNILLNVTVNSDDLGKVIGKGGKVANSIRTLARSDARTKNKNVTIKFGE